MPRSFVPPILLAGLVLLTLACKPRNAEEAAGLLDEGPTPVNVSCQLVDRDRTVNLSITFDDLEAPVTGVQLAVAGWDEPAPGRGEQTADGGYTIVFEGGVITLGDGRVWQTPQLASTGVLTVDVADPAVVTEPVSCVVVKAVQRS